MQSQLARVRDGFVSARERLRRLVREVPLERWGRRPPSGGWSAAECVAHLNLTGAAYVSLLGEALARGREMPPHAGRYRRDPAGFLLSVMLGPLLGIGRFRVGRVKTVPGFVPGSDLERGAVVAEFERLQDEQIALLGEADGLPLNDLRIVSPFDARVQYNVYSAFVVLPRHQHRHLAQAERAAA